MMMSRQMSALAIVGVALVGPAATQAQVAVEAQVATQIVDRMPEGAGTEFPGDVGELYCWARVTDGGGATIQHVWIYGEMEFPVSLEVGGSPWRTWSSKTIPPEWAGAWRVEVRDGEGNVLATVSFTVGS
jgi:hypothetical protein